jgi:DNA-binding response OmpR family regulator
MKQTEPLQILLVESHDDVAQAIVRLLSTDGHMISRAGTLAEAQELCEDGRFDLLITGHRLPDGPACELLEKMNPCERVPGILVAADDDEMCGVSLGFRAQLHAPLTLPALRNGLCRRPQIKYPNGKKAGRYAQNGLREDFQQNFALLATRG